ncbi:hypothetical protein GXW82_28205 [Streptacidiphilus sp. 4-A2]|nr:hypothetical protein [Streptacidiphilus sp. 4-A2]
MGRFNQVRARSAARTPDQGRQPGRRGAGPADGGTGGTAACGASSTLAPFNELAPFSELAAFSEFDTASELAAFIGTAAARLPPRPPRAGNWPLPGPLLESATGATLP